MNGLNNDVSLVEAASLGLASMFVQLIQTSDYETSAKRLATFVNSFPLTNPISLREAMGCFIALNDVRLGVKQEMVPLKNV